MGTWRGLSWASPPAPRGAAEGICAPREETPLASHPELGLAAPCFMSMDSDSGRRGHRICLPHGCGRNRKASQAGLHGS